MRVLCRYAVPSRTDKRLLKCKQHLVYLKYIIIAVDDEILNDNVKLAAVGDVLTDRQKNFLSGDIGDIYIIGGSSVVSTSVENALAEYGAVTRVYGNSRFETSVKVAEHFFDAPQAAVLAYALNFPDGLCGGALAYSMGAPLILTDTGYEQAAADYAAGTDIRDGYVLGGSGLISDNAAAMIFALPDGYVIEAK